MFPITGELREFALFLEWIVLFCYTEIGLLYILKSFGKNKNIRSSQERAYAFLFFSYSLMWFWRILADYYSPNLNIRNVLIFYSIISQMISAFIFILLIEIMKTFYKRFLFSIIFISFVIALTFLSIVNVGLAYRITFFIWIIYLSSSIYYLTKLRKIEEYKENIKIFCIYFISGFTLLVIGLWMTSSTPYELFGIGVRIIGDFFQLFAILLLYIFLNSLPAYPEFDWFDTIEYVIIMDKSGTLLYSIGFSGEEGDSYASLISGHIYSIQVILQGITKKKDITVINREQNIVIIYPGIYINGIIICKKDLNSLRTLIAKFVYKIEAVYSNVLKSWKGDLEIFKPIKQIYNEIFHFKKK